MKIDKIRVYEGKNIYSYKKCIRMDLDLEGYREVPSKEIDGFNETLINYIPKLKEHCCCIGKKGGFLKRLEEGTYLSHICEHSIIALQNMLGSDVSFGKAREIQGEKYYIIYQYEYKNMAIECGKVAVSLINSIINRKKFNLEEKIKELGYILKSERLGPSTLSIVEEASKKGIPVTRIGDNSMFQLGYGSFGKRIEATICESTSTIGADIACDKLLCKDILRDQCIPVAKGYKVNNYIDLLLKAEKIGYPLVLKPQYGNQGKGVFVKLKNQKDLIKAYKSLSVNFDDIIVEGFLKGNDYRICVVDNKIVAGAKRIPPYIIGDGLNTICSLIGKLNSDINRGEGHEKPLTKIKIDKELKDYIKKQGYSLSAVPLKGESVMLRQNANLSTGGVSVDCTDEINEEIKDICLRASKAIGLNICGIDVCCEDITKPIGPRGGIIEVNAAPGIRMHQYPYKGKKRNVAKAIVDMMFKETNGRIPIISVTGTNGKTTTSRLISYIFKLCGKKVGYTTTGGVYVGDKCIEKGDTTGYDSATTVLTNKDVEVAVLELARGGIIRGGLPYDFSDVSVITNITEDHLGLDGIDTLDQMAFVKSLVGEAVKKDGYVVMNADDKASTRVIERMKSNVILFSKYKDNPLITKHIKEGKCAVYLDKNSIYLFKENKNIKIIDVKDISITLEGKLSYNIENAMAVISAMISIGIDIDILRKGLKTFSSDEKSNPGRFNMYNVNGVSVVLDYGHNIEGYKAVLEGAKKIEHNKLIGVIGVPGDRSYSSTLKVANISAENFDIVYIKEDRDRRGKKPSEIADLIQKGMINSGFNENNIYKILNEEEALKKAIDNSKEGDLIVMFFEEFQPALKIVKEKKENKNKKNKEIAFA
ncbi:cyanophycin synthetase [Clostridium oceanicum]|uniref:Cyanophycin synthetase n=1 Tax=Clostridium oceanicum TaxID=1543 RepID=A0ABP3UZB1_9CLOT